MSDEFAGEFLPVKIMNPKDIQLVIEHEPEHFVCETFVLSGALTAQPNNAVQQMNVDLLRKGISILPIDAPVVVCHSQAQAQKADNQVANVPNPQGAYLPVGTPVSFEGSGALFIINTVTTANRVSTVQTRRGIANA